MKFCGNVEDVNIIWWVDLLFVVQDRNTPISLFRCWICINWAYQFQIFVVSIERPTVRVVVPSWANNWVCYCSINFEGCNLKLWLERIFSPSYTFIIQPTYFLSWMVSMYKILFIVSETIAWIFFLKEDLHSAETSDACVLYSRWWC